jgi:hypothetical protein
VIYCACPRCRRAFELPDTVAGFTIACTGCGQPFQIMRAIMRRSCSLTIFSADELPDDRRTVDKAGWNVHAIVCPRSRFPGVKKSGEFDRPGVYVLSSPYEEEGAIPFIYIGEGDPTRPRLEQHYRKMDFWTSLVVFTATDQLNKAHVQYLESRLVSMAHTAKRCIVKNNNKPQLPTLPLADTAAMDVFLKETLVICNLLRLTAFEGPPLLPKPDVAPRPRKLRR